MRRRLVFLTSAALAVSGMTFSGTSRADDRPDADSSQSGGPQMNEGTRDSSHRDTDKNARPDADSSQSGGPTLSETAREASATTQPIAIEEGHAKGIRSELAKATDAAVTKGEFNDLCQQLAKADRDRIGKFADNRFADLDTQIATFRQTWKEKYSEDFKLGDKDLAMIYGPEQFRITRGMTESARTAGERIEPSAPDTNVRSDTSVQPGVASNGGNKPADDTAKQEADYKDRAAADEQMNEPTATVTIARVETRPEVSVPMVHEGLAGWRIDIPDSEDGQRLHNNLLHSLTKLNQEQDKWPTDKAEAYRCVSHCVMSAVEGQNTNGVKSGDTNP